VELSQSLRGDQVFLGIHISPPLSGLVFLSQSLRGDQVFLGSPKAARSGCTRRTGVSIPPW